MAGRRFAAAYFGIVVERLAEEFLLLDTQDGAFVDGDAAAQRDRV